MMQPRETSDMPEETPIRSALRWGAILGGFLAAYGLLFRLLDLSYKSIWSWVFYIAVPIGGYMALRAARRRGALGGYRRAFAIALLASTVGSGIHAGYVYVYNRYVDDSLLLEVREDLLVSALKVRPGSGAEAEQRRRVEAFTRPALFSVAVFLRLVAVGLVSSVVLAWRLGVRAGPRPLSDGA
jgi:hypothetical protein